MADRTRSDQAASGRPPSAPDTNYTGGSTPVSGEPDPFDLAGYDWRAEAKRAGVGELWVVLELDDELHGPPEPSDAQPAYRSPTRTRKIVRTRQVDELVARDHRHARQVADIIVRLAEQQRRRREGTRP
jgi:hypothetical protein